MYKYLMKAAMDTWQNVLHGMDCIECNAYLYLLPPTPASDPYVSVWANRRGQQHGEWPAGLRAESRKRRRPLPKRRRRKP